MCNVGNVMSYLNILVEFWLQWQGGDCNGTRNCSDDTLLATPRPQWPVTRWPEIDGFGRSLNILHTFPRENQPNCQSFKDWKLFGWFLMSCLRAFNFHFLIIVIVHAPMIIRMIEIHCIPAHEEAFSDADGRLTHYRSRYQSLPPRLLNHSSLVGWLVGW